MTTFTQRKEWRMKPGFWDPYTVAKACVQILMRDVHPHRQPLKISIHQKVKSNKADPCVGILLYMQPPEDCPEIDTAVNNYIQFPCQQRLTLAIGQASKTALQFLLSYLRKRGPFINWPLRWDEAKNSVNSTRHVITWANKMLQSLPELDFCAAAVIGRYLHYLNHVSIAHDMFYMKDHISMLWGPLYIKFDNDPIDEFTDEMLIRSAFKIFRAMLEGVHWYQFRPTEDMQRSLFPTDKLYGFRRGQEIADIFEEQTTVPRAYRGNICEQAFEDLITNGLPHDPPEELVGEEEGGAPHAYCADKKFPPDHCNISITGHNPGENYL